MHGLVLFSIQRFVIDTYGTTAWAQLLAAASLVPDGFEAMQIYDDDLSERVVAAACVELGKRRNDLLEDLGTYLISHPHQRIARRLLRFSGDTFTEFLLALDDLPDRVALAVPELRFPGLAVRRKSTSCFDLRVDPGMPGFGLVLLGTIRAMADDYGALVLSDCIEAPDGAATLRLELLDAQFARARAFQLGART